MALSGVGLYSLVRATGAPPVTAPISQSTPPRAAQFRKVFYGSVVKGERALCGYVNARDKVRCRPQQSAQA
ncbi:hypothetical protein CS8_096420 [Cupriavidus sp. 8B]